MAEQVKDTPAFKSSAYEEQYHDWRLVNDVIRGTRHLHTRAQEYLPQEPKESPTAYRNRLHKSIFWNAFKRTIQGLTGMVFRRNPTLGNDVPTSIQDDWENIDLAGTHGDVFARDLFKWMLTDGHAFILVDMPPAVTDQKPDATAADEIGRRPYWVAINKGDVINTRVEKDANGTPRLTLAVIAESLIAPSGSYLEQEITQFRVLRPGSWEIYQKKNDSEEYNLVDSGTTSLDYIPLVPVYASRTAFLQSEPPLLDLAYENLRHYRLQSDLDHILHVANVPILYAVNRINVNPEGSTQSNEVVIGANSLVDLEKDGKIAYAEHAGHAIGAAQEEIQNSKANMATLGLLLLQGKPSAAKTATESVLDYEAESSELAGMARGLEDGIECALGIHADFLGLGRDGGGSIDVNTDFARLQLDPQRIVALSNMVALDQLRLETLWKILQQAEELPSDFDAEEERAAIEKERAALPTYAPEALNLRTNIKPEGPPGTTALPPPDMKPNGNQGQQHS